MQFPKVLVVDDEEKMCYTLKKLLELSKYQAEVAHDGHQAIEKLKSFEPHCVLLDLRMPNMNGIDVLKEIKSLQPETAVIMTTAFITEEAQNECLSAGANDYLTKPINFQTLLEKIGGLVKSVQKVS